MRRLGTPTAIAHFEEKLTRQSIVHRRLVTSHAFHSPMMDPIMAAFRAEAAKVPMAAPAIPYVSCVTGVWITPEDATSPDYWAQHLRRAVRFSDGIQRLLEREESLLLEVGPGRVLATLARQNLAKGAARTVLSSLSEVSGVQDDSAVMLQSLGSLWVAAARPDWQKLHAASRRQRVSLPTYPFERKRFWLADANKSVDTDESHSPTIIQRPVPIDSAAHNPAPAPREILSMNQSVATPTKPRQETIRGLLVEIFEELSGLDIASEDPAASFLEIGFDSLFLTQVTQSLQSKFGLKITFRQLMDDLSTLNHLSAYVDAHVAPGLYEEAAPAPARRVCAACGRSGDGGISRACCYGKRDGRVDEESAPRAEPALRAAARRSQRWSDAAGSRTGFAFSRCRSSSGSSCSLS